VGHTKIFNSKKFSKMYTEITRLESKYETILGNRQKTEDY